RDAERGQQHELGVRTVAGNRLRLLYRHDGVLVPRRSLSLAGVALGVDAEHALHRDRSRASAPGSLRLGARRVNFVEFIRGIGNVMFVMAIAGAVAYVGDRVGHRVGRQRLSLFNIRPRYTSTIIAVATGMIIALVVTLAAIFASQQVKTAFFRLAEINAEIQKAQARAQDLERKVTTEHVVVSLDSIVSPLYGNIPINAPAGLRRDRIQDFYDQTVSYVDRTYTSPRWG